MDGGLPDEGLEATLTSLSREMLYRTLREVVDYDGYYYAAKCLTSLARRFLPKNVSRAGSCEPVDYRVAEFAA